MRGRNIRRVRNNVHILCVWGEKSKNLQYICMNLSKLSWVLVEKFRKKNNKQGRLFELESSRTQTCLKYFYGKISKVRNAKNVIALIRKKVMSYIFLQKCRNLSGQLSYKSYNIYSASA